MDRKHFSVDDWLIFKDIEYKISIPSRIPLTHKYKSNKYFGLHLFRKNHILINLIHSKLWSVLSSLEPNLKVFITLVMEIRPWAWMTVWIWAFQSIYICYWHLGKEMERSELCFGYFWEGEAGNPDLSQTSLSFPHVLSSQDTSKWHFRNLVTWLTRITKFLCLLFFIFSNVNQIGRRKYNTDSFQRITRTFCHIFGFIYLPFCLHFSKNCHLQINQLVKKIQN